MLKIKIGKNIISEKNKTYFIADIAANHDGSLDRAKKLIRLEDIKIPENFDYNKIKSMSIEAKQKLSKIRPITISQASRISGVSPSDISVLLIYMGR